MPESGHRSRQRPEESCSSRPGTHYHREKLHLQNLHITYHSPLMAVVVKLFNNLEITMILSQFFQYLIIADSYQSIPANHRASKSPFYAGIWHIELRDGINLMSPRNHSRQIPLITNKLSQEVTRDVCHENPGNCRAPHYLLNVSVSRLP